MLFGWCGLGLDLMTAVTCEDCHAELRSGHEQQEHDACLEVIQRVAMHGLLV